MFVIYIYTGSFIYIIILIDSYGFQFDLSFALPVERKCMVYVSNSAIYCFNLIDCLD